MLVNQRATQNIAYVCPRAPPRTWNVCNVRHKKGRRSENKIHESTSAARGLEQYKYNKQARSSIPRAPGSLEQQAVSDFFRFRLTEQRVHQLPRAKRGRHRTPKTRKKKKKKKGKEEPRGETTKIQATVRGNACVCPNRKRRCEKSLRRKNRTFSHVVETRPPVWLYLGTRPSCDLIYIDAFASRTGLLLSTEPSIFIEKQQRRSVKRRAPAVPNTDSSYSLFDSCRPLYLSNQIGTATLIRWGGKRTAGRCRNQLHLESERHGRSGALARHQVSVHYNLLVNEMRNFCCEPCRWGAGAGGETMVAFGTGLP